MILRPRVGTLFALLALAAPANADGPLEFGAGVGTRWYDHSNPGANDSFSARTIRPWIRYDGLVSNWNLDTYAHHRLEFYSGSPSDSAFTGRSRQASDQLDLLAVRRWSAREDLTIGGNYLHSQDLFDQDLGTALNYGNVSRWAGQLGTHAGIYEASARVRGTHYEDDPRLADSRSLGWLGRLVPIQRSTDEAFVGATGSQLDVAGATELISLRPTAGYRRHISPTMTAEIEGGAAFNRFADGGDEKLPLIGLGFRRAPDRGRAIAIESRVRFEGDSLAAASAEARYPVASGLLRLGAQSDAAAEGGYYTSANRTTAFTTSIEDTLARANVLGLSGSYAITRPLRGDGPSTDLVRATAWAVRRLQPWLDIRVAASYAHETARSFRPAVRRVRLEAELNLLASGFGSDAFGALTGVRP